MPINFKPLSSLDFPLLLKWLEMPHVKLWWDPEIKWTAELIEEKYSSYLQGYKIEKGKKKEIFAFIIYSNEVPIGYIQAYNAHDFLDDELLKDLPESLASFDVFIGEKEYLFKNFGSKALKAFFEEYFTQKYKYVLASTDYKNIATINSYTKSGFTVIEEEMENGNFIAIKNLEADKKIRDFLISYKNAGLQKDIEPYLDHFSYPCFLKMQNKNLFLERKELKIIMSDLIKAWFDRGLVEGVLDVIEINYFSDKIIQVHANWSAVNKNNQIFTSFESIYQLTIDENNQLKIYNLTNLVA